MTCCCADALAEITVQLEEGERKYRGHTNQHLAQ